MRISDWSSDVCSSDLLGFALGGEAGDNQAHRGAQVGRHYRLADKGIDAAHDRAAAAHVDVAAHARQFGAVNVAVLEAGFGEQRRTGAERSHRHELRLHFGSDTGVARHWYGGGMMW